MNSQPTLTLDALRKAKADLPDGRGRKALFPDKQKFLHYLTDWAQQRLATLAKNAKVSQSDFLEILIRRYGVRAGSDILAATGDDNGPSEETAGIGA